MKEGLQIGDTAIIRVEVTEDKFARFGEEVVHPTYSTASMVYDMEWASRKVLLPFIEENEESAGAAVQVKHIAPSALRTFIEVKAIVKSITNRKIVTEVVAKNEYGLIGKGEVEQVILPKGTMREKLDRQIQMESK
ncbi:thioesterase family protein [Oceanobacillus sp. J11TS1]|uniref:thioesterase family protein n=1 Tax=Oceanobacillus sp. J11TS1 TaxID=2807191 RepID=UPI001B11A500|nr:thioesterase [Oceanobacillus sp. J11TS1]GIO22746.1 thioesterase [Oceanobacillus sp. J11TS1]